MTTWQCFVDWFHAVCLITNGKLSSVTGICNCELRFELHEKRTHYGIHLNDCTKKGNKSSAHNKLLKFPERSYPHKALLHTKRPKFKRELQRGFECVSVIFFKQVNTHDCIVSYHQNMTTSQRNRRCLSVSYHLCAKTSEQICMKCWERWQWTSEQTVKFWWRSGSWRCALSHCF